MLLLIRRHLPLTAEPFCDHVRIAQYPVQTTTADGAITAPSSGVVNSSNYASLASTYARMPREV